METEKNERDEVLQKIFKYRAYPNKETAKRALKSETHKPSKNKETRERFVFYTNTKTGKLVGCRLEYNKLIIPKIGIFKIKMHRPVEGTIKKMSVTFNENLLRWFVSFSCDIGKMPPKKTKGESVKIFMSDDCFLQDSHGNIIPSLDFYERSEDRIKQLRERIDRRKEGSWSSKQRRRYDDG